MLSLRYTLIFILASFTTSLAQPQWKVLNQELLFTDPPFKNCHASTIMQTKTGRLLVACFGGSQESKPDVTIWLRDLNATKQQPVMVADGVINDTLRYPCWNPVLFQSRSGKLFLFYKVGPNPREWWGMLKTSADDGRTWSAARRLPDGILGPIKNKPVQLSNGVILAPSSTEENSGRWKAHIESSADDGNTWTSAPVDTTGAFDVIQPSILSYKGGRLQLLCRSKQGAVVQAWSADGGRNWGKLSKTSLLNPNSGTDAVTLRSGTQLIVYNPDVPGKDWYNGRGKLRVAVSKDGQTWRDIAMLENGSKEEYSYPAVIQTRDGLIHITYTYNRVNIKHVVLQEGK
ncbi:sialidase [Mucilaginibacter terrenus]|uniref:Sialidase n=2 Tax=Mucilaginibacter terrenus TaxID=2482727 RepID=A0A3E2NWL3_9SPHI|nr:sialidase [Mucilaginibacter terrenus]